MRPPNDTTRKEGGAAAGARAGRNYSWRTQWLRKDRVTSLTQPLPKIGGKHKARQVKAVESGVRRSVRSRPTKNVLHSFELKNQSTDSDWVVPLSTYCEVALGRVPNGVPALGEHFSNHFAKGTMDKINLDIAICNQVHTVFDILMTWEHGN